MLRLIVLAILAVFLQGGKASAQKSAEASRSYLDEGLSQFKEKNYEKAIELFETGYEQTEKPEYLFALGQAERLSGDCVSARVYYERYLDVDLSAAQRDAATRQLSKCEAALGSSPVVPDENPAFDVGSDDLNQGTDASGSVDVKTLKPVRTSPWYKDALGDGLLGASVITGVGSLVLWRLSENAEQSAYNSETHGGYTDDIDDATTKRNFSIVAAGTSVAFMTAALWRYATRDKKIMENTPTSMTVDFTRKTAIVSVLGTF